LAGRPAPGPAATGAPLVAGLQQAVVDELVQVVGGQRAADPDGGGSVVPAHRLPALGHVAVQGAAQGVTKPGEASQLLIDVAGFHTLPEATIAAFEDHGTLDSTLTKASTRPARPWSAWPTSAST